MVVRLHHHCPMLVEPECDLTHSRGSAQSRSSTPSIDSISWELASFDPAWSSGFTPIAPWWWSCSGAAHTLEVPHTSEALRTLAAPHPKRLHILGTHLMQPCMVPLLHRHCPMVVEPECGLSHSKDSVHSRGSAHFSGSTHASGSTPRETASPGDSPHVTLHGPPASPQLPHGGGAGVRPHTLGGSAHSRGSVHSSGPVPPEPFGIF
ncbi:uncharacterized protein [Nothobranchius furzeri]|uniref:uncharacterized protein n=1 Tax=Nothobranchius furzeri TaxID=105023 RepID=UPI0039049B42